MVYRWLTFEINKNPRSLSTVNGNSVRKYKSFD